MNTTKAQIVEAIYAAIPYANQIVALDLDSESNAVRFTWRGDRFRVTDNFHVEECQPGILSGSNIAIVLEHLLKKTAK